jgi:hypothetical protein
MQIIRAELLNSSSYYDIRATTNRRGFPVLVIIDLASSRIVQIVVTIAPFVGRSSLPLSVTIAPVVAQISPFDAANALVRAAFPRMTPYISFDLYLSSY